MRPRISAVTGQRCSPGGSRPASPVTAPREALSGQAPTRGPTPHFSHLFLVVAVAFLGTDLPACAQSITRWTTNYYTVTGATVREVRRSMTSARPWKNANDADATTTWKVEWRFHFDQSPNGCRSTGASTVTTILTTLPRYVPPTNATPDALERWKIYFPILARHEENHARFAITAAAEIERQLGSAGEQPDCASLQRTLNETANQILQKHRQDERAYDQRTRHGATEGARFP